MKQRGRKSAAELAVVVQGNFGKRPEPPADLTEDQAEVWRRSVSSEPLDFFSTEILRDLLKGYCRHTATANSLSEIIDSFKPEWLKAAEGAKRYGELLRMRDAEVSAAIRLATKLRVTNQSRYTPRAAESASRNTARGYKPWEE
jgi:hypothetical protein